MLTPAEWRVANLVSKGWSITATAGALFVTERTVKQHFQKICAKLGLDPNDRPPGVAVALARPVAMQFTDARGPLQFRRPTEKGAVLA
jgi:DNA-binding NarL/FixJ family response regulator